ncbi:Aste57867_11186 [Aphanomyces stellatus]|uniref:Aste57867_11186 protein n=1 Tax=Aphanomyces stellatus TaxID=120398 RepID=A0A485KS81_9STRA|nr:hypothetical protein As57867_011144 [Aphanomyces stellatus]VFT88053.1 Aste57867_11186 [Aphanomyces stellatus]
MGKSKRGGAKKSAAAAAAPAPKRKAPEYYSGSSDEEGFDNFKQVVPLPSLENAGVRDFTAHHEQEPVVSKKKKNKNKPAKEGAVPAHVANEPEQKKKKPNGDLPLAERKKRQQEQTAIRSEKVVWRKFGRENTAFEQYYSALWGLDKSEWKVLAKVLETSPAVHFRINGTFPSLSDIAKGSLDCDFDVDGSILKLSSGDERTLSLQPVAWAEADKSIWKVNVDSKLLRKTKQLDGINTFIRDQTTIGTLVRQEPTNMLLPVYLDVAPGHAVLDIYGSGASRAAQCVERLVDANNDLRGVLVVNEQDAAGATNAARMVAHTVGNASPVVVTAHKSEEFPVLDNGAIFDRVLCSAPCSGDGSIRKFPEKWRTWTPSTAYAHHATQLELAHRSLHLLKVDGLLVYTTRAFSPIENEAVVADLLRTGACELVDVSDAVPGLRTRPGLTTWSVVDDALTAFPSFDEAPDGKRRQLKLRPTMFPPKDKKLHLERCVRLLPHDNDTHGIFVAVLRKTKEVARVAAGPTAAPASAEAKKGVKAVQKNKRVGLYTAIEDDQYEDLVARFGIDLPPTHFMEHMSFTKTRDLHYVSTEAAELIAQYAASGRLHVQKAGTIAFQVEKTTLSVADDGLHAVLPHCSERVITLDMAEFSQLVTTKHAWLKHLSEKAQAQLEKLEDGSVVLALDESEPVQTADTDIAIVATKRHSSLSVTASSSTIGRIKALLLELNVDEGDEGYDSMEYDE